MNHEVNKKTHISNDTEVYTGFEKDLGDNGLRDDASMTCMIAPEVNGDGEWLYLSTNGDPVVVGYIDTDGELELSDDAREWMNADDMRWLQSILMDVFDVKFYTEKESV